MTIITGSGTWVDDSRQQRQDLLAELREVEHWRRLVAARLDLAVAAVCAPDEPAVRHLPTAPVLPYGLREIIGLPSDDRALAETAALERLRDTLRDLDAYAAVLREALAAATTRVLRSWAGSESDRPAHNPVVSLPSTH